MSERTTSSALTWSHRRTNFLEIKTLDKCVTISSKTTLANRKERNVNEGTVKEPKIVRLGSF